MVEVDQKARLILLRYVWVCVTAIFVLPGADGADGPKWGPIHAKPISLIDHQGQPFTQTRFIGKWTMIFFGYTHCPDVCPLTLTVIKDVHRLVENKVPHDRLQYVFVSVDPDRDTPEQLARYVKYFGEFLLGVTGKTDDIETLVIACGAHYEFDDPDERGNYTISHTASISLVDPKGELIGVFPEPHNAESISRALVDVVNKTN